MPTRGLFSFQNNSNQSLTNSQKALMNNIKELDKAKNSGYEYWIPDQNNIMEMNASFIGPEGTPYWGGMYLLNIVIDEHFHPYKPPKISFLTKIYHPNISECGDISLDVLTSDYSPVLTIFKLLLSIQSLLSEPNPNETLNEEAGKLYVEDYELFEQIAVEWKLKHCPNLQ